MYEMEETNVEVNEILSTPAKKSAERTIVTKILKQRNMEFYCQEEKKDEALIAVRKGHGRQQ